MLNSFSGLLFPGEGKWGQPGSEAVPLLTQQSLSYTPPEPLQYVLTCKTCSHLPLLVAASKTNKVGKEQQAIFSYPEESLEVSGTGNVKASPCGKDHGCRAWLVGDDGDSLTLNDGDVLGQDSICPSHAEGVLTQKHGL
ncbi:hypothetical protein P7K49_031489 [Saguinus oedipus]|uniref:Uncharacterized protein n=1 Tax=Saguinus oedipus TaxID=9490 RepID=A0ABQ9U0P9_SAGOE|nr:hypothetical protein P7K49_031489 [Saguinus oedipus]